MRDLYKGRWASFIGNAGIRILFNLDDFETAEYWSKTLGGRRVETRGRQEDIYGYSQGENIGESMRPLLSPEELMLTFNEKRLLVLAQGERPFIAARLPYFENPAFGAPPDTAWDDPRGPIPGATLRPKLH